MSLVVALQPQLPDGFKKSYGLGYYVLGQVSTYQEEAKSVSLLSALWSRELQEILRVASGQPRRKGRVNK